MGRRNKPRGGVAVDGMLLLDKPPGATSNQALQHAKRLLNANKAGHTGSLDPIATGLLPLCFGETTKISELFLTADKEYWTRIQLGVHTDTGDRAGQVQRRASVDFSRPQLLAALARFRGQFAQIPPMHSALKHNGQPLYRFARKGVTVERAPRTVTVYALSLQEWHEDTLELTLCCSRGFYVRTLATELGEVLGCGAHVSELRRTAVGNFSIEHAVTIAQLEALGAPHERQRLLLPTEQSVAHLPAVHLPESLASYLCRGRTIRAASAPPDGWVRVYSDRDGFLGLGEIAEPGKITPRRLFDTACATHQTRCK